MQSVCHYALCFGKLTAVGLINKLTHVTPDTTIVSPDNYENQAPSTVGMTTKIVKGSIWTLAGSALPLLVTLVTVPFTIRLLGAEGYGVLVLVGLIPHYLGFADFGMSLASTKFGSTAYAEGNPEKEGRVIRTAAAIALAAVTPIALFIVVFSTPIVDVVFNVREQFRAEASTALKIAACAFVVSLLCSIVNTPQLARLRMDLNSMINAGPRIVGTILTPIVLYFGYGIIGAVTVALGAALMNLAGHIVVSSRLLPQLLGMSVDRTAARAMIRYGGAFVIGAIAGVALINAEKGILASTVSTTALAYYSVAFSFAIMLTLFSGSMVQSLFPAFSQLQGTEKKVQLNSIYSRAIRISMIWSLPALVFLALIAKPFFTLWAGPDFGRESSLPLYLLLAGLLFNIFAYVPHSIIMASGRTDIFAKLYWIELIPYLAVVWLLASRYGAAGAAAAWSLRVIADAAAHFFLANRIAGVTIGRRGIAGFAAGSAIMLVPVAAMLYYAETHIWIALLSLLSLAVYGLIAWRTILEQDEIDWVTNKLNVRFAR